MKVRGERECADCGRRWSYYDTGSVACPECGSLRSVAAGERKRHTDAPATLDLSDASRAVSDDAIDDAARLAGRAAREYVDARGFIDADALRELDAAYVAAAELRAVADRVENAVDDEAAERYFVSLLDGAPDGERPPPEDVPGSLRSARALADASAADDYRGEVTTWLRDREPSPAVDPGPVLERLDDHVSRIEALDGNVSPSAADAVVAAARDVGEALRESDPAAVERARARFTDVE